MVFGKFTEHVLILIMTVFKSLNNKKPQYIYENFKIRNSNKIDGIFPQRQSNKIIIKNYQRSLSRGGFMYRGAKLYNSLRALLRSETKLSVFKRKTKRWVAENINIKPP